MIARSKIPSMPVDSLARHPAAMTLPAAGFGLLMRLSIHFWQTECQPLPSGDNELYCIARAHRPTWRRHKARILRILADVMPELERAWRSHKNRRDNLLRLGQHGASMRALNARKKEAPISTLGGRENSSLIGANFAPRRTEENRAQDRGTSSAASARRGGFTERLK